MKAEVAKRKDQLALRLSAAVFVQVCISWCELGVHAHK